MKEPDGANYARNQSFADRRRVIKWMLAAAASAAILPRQALSTDNDPVPIAKGYGWDRGKSSRASTAAVSVNPLREVYFGDLHLHTSYSLDAYFLASTKVNPEDAYRFARGETVDYLGRAAQRREPLDFLAVTDHAENLGVIDQLENPDSVVSKSALGQKVKLALDAAVTPQERVRALNSLGTTLDAKDAFPAALKAESHSAWQREIEFANRNYEPGKFTTFIAYEWTAMSGMGGIHRNVIFRGNSAPDPFTSLDSNRPEDLWAWLEKIRQQGYEALAIPHNGNVSNGLMYDWVNSGGQPIDDVYAQERQRNEPVSEIAQSKGKSEVYPLAAPNDEFANFEIMETWRGKPVVNYRPGGSYLRDALSRGLVLERRIGVNPFKYGFVGGSDIHSGLSISSPQDWGAGIWRANVGGGALNKQEAGELLQGRLDVPYGPGTTAGALTGVWAESNTRESIYQALRRRETFATSGSRLKFRFFAGWSFDARLVKKPDWIVIAYREGVPMGGDLPTMPAGAKAPTFAIWAAKDPNGANLDRVQVVKVWEEEGKQREKIFDVAWSGNRKLDPVTGKLPAVGNSVDLETGAYSNAIGSTELSTVWADPEFVPGSFTAYYLRVLEIPTPRWSTSLAIRHGVSLPKNLPATEQQRGWSSPIWYSPVQGTGATVP